jgi:hypothetical protein
MNDTIETETKASRLLLFAWMETEKRLPAEAKALIEKYDVKHREWAKAGWPMPMPPELHEMDKEIIAHPLASIPWELRRRSNMAHHAEWAKENAK